HPRDAQLPAAAGAADEGIAVRPARASGHVEAGTAGASADVGLDALGPAVTPFGLRADMRGDDRNELGIEPEHAGADAQDGALRDLPGPAQAAAQRRERDVLVDGLPVEPAVEESRRQFQRIAV